MKRFSTRFSSFIVTVSVLTALATPVFVSTVRADWDPTDPAKWVQLPDLQPTGMDVLATYSPLLPYNKILADDFLCTLTGPITDIHIWGSWLNDRLPHDPLTGAPLAPVFHLSIHSDIPVQPGITYSRPGQELWSVNVIPNQMRIYATGNESFYDPNQNAIIGSDTQVWQYNFLIPEALAFHQELGNIYWLDVQVMPQPFEDQGGAPFAFGWKTSASPHFNDDAVFGDNDTFGGAPLTPPGWREMHYPAGHPLAGQSIDLAFVLTTIPEPSSCLLAVLGSGLLLVLKRRNQIGRK